MNEILCSGLLMAMLNYGKMYTKFYSLGTSLTTNGEHSWRRMRRASQEALTKARVTEFYPLQEKEAVILIDGMLQNPTGWDGELRR